MKIRIPNSKFQIPNSKFQIPKCDRKDILIIFFVAA